jgi:protein-L-isoaspartate(D-aspartate) O-methyltransferase
VATGDVVLRSQVALHWDTDQAVDLTALRGVLDQPKTAVWSTVTVGGHDPFDGVWLRLTSTEPGTCRIAAEPGAIDAKLCTPAIPSPQPRPGRGRLTGLLAGPELANRLCDQIRAWDQDRTTRPIITAYPADTPDDQLHGTHAITKQNSRLTVSY